MSQTHIILYALFFLVFCACDSTAQREREIQGLEQRLATHFTIERCDSLVTLYRNLAKENPSDHANNLRYLTRAAEVHFTKRENGAAAARWLDDALIHHAEGQDITETVAVYARMYNSVQYKSASTYHLDPKDITAMQNHLMANYRWLDSALVRLDRRMNVNGSIEDKTLANQFIDISEGYAAITKSEDKYAELLMRAAGLAKTIESYNKAITLYYRLSNRLPDHPKSRTALFMQGFIYENDLNELEKAKTTYEAFLEKYPDDADYADDIKIALKTLGKTPEDLIKSFKN